MKNTRIESHRAKVYRTDHYTQDQILHLKESANNQDKKIARWFFMNPTKKIGPTHLHQTLFPNAPYEQEWLVTSTRRSIANLTKDGILVKTKETCKSLRNGTEHKWKWKWPQEPVQADMFGQNKNNGGAYSI